MCVAPCKLCEERSSRCHSTCQEYIEWSNNIRAENTALRNWNYEQLQSNMFPRNKCKKEG